MSKDPYCTLDGRGECGNKFVESECDYNSKTNNLLKGKDVMTWKDKVLYKTSTVR